MRQSRRLGFTQLTAKGDIGNGTKRRSDTLFYDAPGGVFA
jgi:hypothetical protein